MRLLLDHLHRAAEVVEGDLVLADDDRVVVAIGAAAAEAAVGRPLRRAVDEAHGDHDAAAAEAGQAAGLELHGRLGVAHDAGPRGAVRRRRAGEGGGDDERGRDGRRECETHFQRPSLGRARAPESERYTIYALSKDICQVSH